MRERDVKIAEQNTGDSLTMNCFDCRVPRRFIPAETDPIIRYAPERELSRERATDFIASNLRPRDTAPTYLPVDDEAPGLQARSLFSIPRART